MRPMSVDHVGHAGAAGLVVRLVLADRVQQDLPLGVVGVRVVALELPDEVLGSTMFWLL